MLQHVKYSDADSIYLIMFSVELNISFMFFCSFSVVTLLLGLHQGLSECTAL